MKKYDNLELRIMSCILLKPELMENIIVEDKHFIMYHRIWKFMKAFYKKFGTFDCNLMYSVCKDKYQILKYMEFLLDLEPTTTNFDLYQRQLIDQFEERTKDTLIIEKVYEWANDLYVRNISTDKFKEKVDKLYEEVK